MCTKSKEKSREEIVLIRYYNVLFYLVFKGGIDDFNRQCLVNERPNPPAMLGRME